VSCGREIFGRLKFELPGWPQIARAAAHGHDDVACCLKLVFERVWLAETE
jgi:hypothetical protein